MVSRAGVHYKTRELSCREASAFLFRTITTNKHILVLLLLHYYSPTTHSTTMLSFNNTFKAAIIALVVGARFIAAVPVSGDIAQRDSYSGASSDASGGSVGQSATDNLQLVKILSGLSMLLRPRPQLTRSILGNGGNGGTSKTGAAGSSFKDGSDTNTGSSFSGAAGPARGGDAVSNGVVEVLSCEYIFLSL